LKKRHLDVGEVGGRYTAPTITFAGKRSRGGKTIKEFGKNDKTKKMKQQRQRSAAKHRGV